MDEVRTALPGGYSPPDREEKLLAEELYRYGSSPTEWSYGLAGMDGVLFMLVSVSLRMLMQLYSGHEIAPAQTANPDSSLHTKEVIRRPSLDMNIHTFF
jgi:hypothetical protein